jgi:hypothetical protein
LARKHTLLRYTKAHGRAEKRRAQACQENETNAERGVHVFSRAFFSFFSEKSRGLFGKSRDGKKMTSDPLVILATVTVIIAAVSGVIAVTIFACCCVPSRLNRAIAGFDGDPDV